MTDQTQPATQPNTITRDELVERIKLLGESGGRGVDHQVKALLSVCEGAYHGLFDLKANKHGADKDDAVFLTEQYFAARAKATRFDHKAPNIRKQTSLFRTMIKGGQWSKGGPGEPMGILDKLLHRRDQLRKDPVQAKNLDDAANTVMKFTRTLLKQDLLPHDAELDGFCFKKQADIATAEERVEAIRKNLQTLSQGDKNGIQDNSAEVRAAIASLTSRLTAIAQAKRGVKKP